MRAFCDSTGDGVGDFRGLTQKLDYMQDLGVTADLAAAVLSLAAAGRWLRHRRLHRASIPATARCRTSRRFCAPPTSAGLKVITELVLNHTSDQHPWFQRARRAKPGSRHRDFYVWSDTPEKYKDARIIFKDFETSNWTWDPVAEAYYWHRFYSHQPDLNFDNPEVRKAIFRCSTTGWRWASTACGWTPCRICSSGKAPTARTCPKRTPSCARFGPTSTSIIPDRMLLAEANQWPEDAVAYFGDGDECHVAFHFPVMPRMFMAVQMEDRFPIIDIMQQTPEIPEICQWVMFLRNHDELTLEMVTDEERDYMYRVYAHNPQARINLGIRRRLAPAAGQQPPEDRTAELAADVAARHAGDLLRRRNRHGRQHLSGRSQRRPHADAMEPRPQRRLLRRAIRSSCICR